MFEGCGREWGECGRARRRVGTLPPGRMPAVLELCVTTRTPCQKGFPLTHLNSNIHTHTPFTVTSKSTHIVNPTFTRATYKTRNIFNLLSVSTILCLSFPRSPAYLHLCGNQKASVSRPILQLFFQHSRGKSLRKSERHLAAMSFNSTHAFFLLSSACSFW